MSVWRMIPYPPVFHDWRAGHDGRVSTAQGTAGVMVELSSPSDRASTWRQVELTENDACLLAAALLLRAGRKKLAKRVLKKLVPS